MKKFMTWALLAATIIACKEDPFPTPTPPTDKYGSGVLITNEGVFNTGTGTVSLYDRDGKSVENEIYQTENSVPVGNLLQSAAQVGDKLYLIVNNSQQIIVAHAGSLIHEATISGFDSPRYMHAVSADKAYVSDWTSNSIKILDLNTNVITGSIPVGNGPENMAQIGSSVFVTNSGGLGVDSTVTVINAITDQVETTFTVGPNPNSIQTDVNGNLWVLCGGIADWQNPANDIGGKIVQYDRTIGAIMKTLDFANNTDHPGKLEINNAGTVLYYLENLYGGPVYELNISNPVLPSMPIISGNFYGLGLDPFNDEIYLSDPLDYNQRGVVYRYSKDAVMIDSVKAGIIPGYFLFR